MSFSTTVSARYTYIHNLSSTISISTSGLAKSTGLVDPSNSSTNTTLTVELQKKTNGVWVLDGGPWSDSGTGTNTVALQGKKYVVHGTYRVVVTAKIYSSSGILLENESCISPELTY